ncbi:EVI5L [Symbiodinium natans]|uniref:EVI5L protein n=1 Tax=Symbiodinium natans TaxID=878477 RepID=A0A812PT01_9DINO|nr:EVI5L [Symbiodinium natans]
MSSNSASDEYSLPTREEAFAAFAHLMDHEDFLLSGLYTGGFPLLHRYLHELENLLMEVLPDLHRHLLSKGVVAMMYAQPWFHTLFITVVPEAAVVRVWGKMLREGPKALLTYALALLQDNKASLLCMDDVEDLMRALRHPRISPAS